MTKYSRYGVMSYGMFESTDGSYMHVEDILYLLRDLTDDDSREAIVNKIDVWKEFLS